MTVFLDWVYSVGNQMIVSVCFKKVVYMFQKHVRKHKKRFGLGGQKGLPLLHKPKTIFFTLEIVPIGNHRREHREMFLFMLYNLQI